MGLNLQQIEDALTKGLELVQKIAPLAGLAGPAAGAWGELIAKVAGTADVVVKELEGDANVIASGDLTKIRELQAQLHTENAALAAQVDDS